MRNNFWNLSLILASTLTAGTACAFWDKPGNGSIETRTYKLAGFNTVEVEGQADLEIKVGEPEVAISTDSNLFEYVDVAVNDGHLRVKTSWRMKPTSRPRVVVALPRLTRLVVSGSVESSVNLGGEARSMDLEASGSCQVSLNHAQLAQLTIKASGSSAVEVKGQTDEFNLESGGNFQGSFQDLIVENAKVDSSGSTTLRFGKVGSISGELRGINSVSYQETPRQSNLKIN